MKTIRVLGCCSFVLLFSTATSRAADPALPLTGISIDTMALRGLPGPFYLDFQFTDGSGAGDANNTVDVRAVYISGGSWVGSPTITGGASRGFSVDLTDTASFNELDQQFIPGISIDLALGMTGVVDLDGTPDRFSLAILDYNKAAIPTTGPGDALIVVEIDSANPTIQAFSSDLSQTSINIPTPSVGGGLPVPEGGVPVVFIGLLCAAGLLLHQKPALPATRNSESKTGITSVVI